MCEGVRCPDFQPDLFNILSSWEAGNTSGVCTKVLFFLEGTGQKGKFSCDCTGTDRVVYRRTQESKSAGSPRSSSCPQVNPGGVEATLELRPVSAQKARPVIAAT